ncbi:MAG: type II secretion system protein N [Candidatus Dactylopiibacterium sp.]|nr:type II secretion system protein N [Candidatus Dactylopiibacterium sp.]
MSRTTRWTLSVAALALIFLIANFPATLAVRLLPATVSLAGVEGSLWNGRATALGINGLVAQQKLAWRFDAGALLRGRIAWNLRSEHAGQPGQLRATAGVGGLALENVRLALPVEPLAQFNPMLTGVRLRGDLQLESPRVARNAPIHVTGSLQRAGSAMAGELTPIGSYRFNADITAQGAGKVDLSTLNGPLQIQGSGSFEGRTGRARLLLRPETDLPGLSPLLATLPREGDDYVLTYPR